MRSLTYVRDEQNTLNVSVNSYFELTLFYKHQTKPDILKHKSQQQRALFKQISHFTAFLLDIILLLPNKRNFFLVFPKKNLHFFIFSNRNIIFAHTKAKVSIYTKFSAYLLIPTCKVHIIYI